MRKGKKYQTKHKMFVSYVCIPVVILTVISCLFSFLYYHMTRERVLNFENSITENVDSELKNLMDNLIKSSAQYSMTPLGNPAEIYAEDTGAYGPEHNRVGHF